MRILRIDHVQLAMPPGREAVARDFYGRILGLVEVPKPASLADRGGVWFSSGAANIHLGVEDDFKPARKAHPALAVLDLSAAIRALREHRVEVPDPEEIEGRLRTFVHDPFGNRIELVDGQR